MAAGNPSSEDSDIDWRRLASDRNVSHVVARALWERACATAPDDPRQAERVFLSMLDEAETANATHEPGRETLVGATPARDASSLGPGKWTRVLLEEQKPGGPGSARRGAEDGRPPSAEGLRNMLIAAGQASKNAAALLAASDPATIVEALRQLRDQEGPGVLQKIMTVAGGTIERLLGQRMPDAQTQPQTQTGSVSEPVEPSAGDKVDAEGAPGPATAEEEIAPASGAPRS